MKDILDYIESNRERFLDELFDLLRIPSISSLEENKPDMARATEYLRIKFLEAGADRAEVIPTTGHPVVFAEKIVNPDLPAVLVYGHYDVQPVDPLELWESPPFDPQIRGGKIYARGADDDKGQFFMHLKAFELMMKTGNLSCNIKFMVEGEEEIGSPSLKKFCQDHREMLKADIILVSDTTMIESDIPSITVGLRGLSYMQVEVTGPNRDLHSGLYGGAVANPVNVLAKMIAALTDENNRVTIPGFYEDVLEATAEEREALNRRPFDAEVFRRSIDVVKESGEEGYTTLERLGIRPCLDVNGIWGGYTGEGAKTILPARASAKISMRLVPNQNSKKIDRLFEDYFRSLAPDGVNVKVESLHGGEGYVSPLDTPGYQAARLALLDTFGKEPIPVRSGGSIPIISVFENVIGAKSILLGFGLDSDAIHSPNENYPLENFYRGIQTIPRFFAHFAEIMNRS